MSTCQAIRVAADEEIPCAHLSDQPYPPSKLPAMPACADPPNRPPADVIDHLIEAVAWAKTCLLITAATDPKSPERVRELDKLRAAIKDPSETVDQILGGGQTVPDAVLVELRTCELAIPKLEQGAVLRQPAAPLEDQRG